MLQLIADDIARFREMVDRARRVVTVCHVAPDGDALGSSLGFCHLMEAMGKSAWAITPDTPSRSLMFMPGARSIIAASRYPDRAALRLTDADLVVCLDFNALMRLDKLAGQLEASRAPRILIDHHLSPETFADLTISRPAASSTCYLLYEVIKAAGLERYMTAEAASCIYTGMMTDTGNFSFNSNDPGLYVDIAELLGYGIDKDRIYKLACDTRSLDQLRLNSYALYERMKVYPDCRCAVIALSLDELRRFNYSKGDTEGLVNQPLSVPEIVWSVFLRQDDPAYVKVSMRSKGDFPVNRVCEDHFGGGGHRNAAGGELHCSLDEAVSLIERVMTDYSVESPGFRGSKI